MYLPNKSSIIYGLPSSGRTQRILQTISKIENLPIEKINSSPDLKVIDLSQSIEDLSYSIDLFSRDAPIELRSKYCIIKNIDFYSNEKQEIFLKSIEDSNVLFYFTAYSSNQIKTKALISRLYQFNIDYTNFYENLTAIQKQIINSSKESYPFKAMSQVNIWNYLSSSITSVSELDLSYLDHKSKMIHQIQSYKEYPQWFIIDQVFLMLSYSIRQRYIKISNLSNLINKLIQNYSLSDLSKIETLSLFMDSCFLVKRSYFKLFNKE